MDGARLLNACVASGIGAREMASGWDSAWIDFSKGNITVLEPNQLSQRITA